MINVSDTNSLYRNSISVPSNVNYGVVVAKIISNSGASKSDLKRGDVIVAINGETVKDTAYLRYELYKYKPGQSIDVTFYRDGKEKKEKVTLSSSKN